MAEQKRKRSRVNSEEFRSNKRKKDNNDKDPIEEQIFEKAKNLQKREKIKRQILFHREVKVIEKDEDFPLPWEEQGNAFLVSLAGRRKSGKNVLLDQFMKTIWLKEFDKIYILSKTAKRQPTFQTWKGDITYVETWDPDFFDKLKKEQEDRKKPLKILIIIDDMSSQMREKLYATNIDDFSYIGRHFLFSICWLVQRIGLLTPGFRQEADGVILFREENMQELRLLHREWGFGEMDNFVNMLVEETTDRFSWIMIRNVGGRIELFRLPSPDESQKFLSNGKAESDATRSRRPRQFQKQSRIRGLEGEKGGSGRRIQIYN